MGNLVQREHPLPQKKLGWKGVGSARSTKKPAISPKRCKIGPRLLLRTNRKSHMRFRLVPKSTTLGDLERHIQGLPKVFKYPLLSENKDLVSWLLAASYHFTSLSRVSVTRVCVYMDTLQQVLLSVWSFVVQSAVHVWTDYRLTIALTNKILTCSDWLGDSSLLNVRCSVPVYCFTACSVSGYKCFLQRVSIACCAKRCISYRKSVRLSVCPSVRPSVTRWHCVKTTPETETAIIVVSVDEA